MENKDNKSMLHSMNKPMVSTSLSTPIVIVIIVAALVLGGATGFGVNYFKNGKGSIASTSEDKTSTDSSKDSAGILDEKAFPDEAEGMLRDGGFEGEGSYHLERPGGKDQNAYLTSTAVDLSKFVGKKVKVRGQTFAAEKAGWLMDVGYIEVIK
jgi:hypothetical protein